MNKSGLKCTAFENSMALRNLEPELGKVDFSKVNVILFY